MIEGRRRLRQSAIAQNRSIIGCNLPLFPPTESPTEDWCPTGFKCGINYQPPTVVPGKGLGFRDVQRKGPGAQISPKPRKPEHHQQVENPRFLHLAWPGTSECKREHKPLQRTMTVA